MSSSDFPLDRPEGDERRTDDEPGSLLDASEETAGRLETRAISPVLPAIASGAGLDLDLDLDSILKPSNPNPDAEKVKKRASNVLKLSQENEKLAAELKAMSDRLEAAERRRKELATKLQSPPSN